MALGRGHAKGLVGTASLCSLNNGHLKYDYLNNGHEGRAGNAARYSLQKRRFAWDRAGSIILIKLKNLHP